MALEYDYVFKLVIIGDSDVGKTSLLLRLTEDCFYKMTATLGVDFKIKRLTVDGIRVKLNIWDTAGQERFRVITKTYYRNADGVVVMYDVTNSQSFVNVKTWLEEIDKNADVALCRILVGTKDDDPAKKCVLTEDAMRCAQQMGTQLVETSAKDNVNVLQVFEEISRMMVKKKKQDLQRQLEAGKNSKIQIKETAEGGKRPKKKCCAS